MNIKELKEKIKDWDDDLELAFDIPDVIPVDIQIQELTFTDYEDKEYDVKCAVICIETV